MLELYSNKSSYVCVIGSNQKEDDDMVGVKFALSKLLA